MGIAINFDTLKISKELEKVGFSPQQAENYHQTRHRKIMVGVNIAILIALAMKFIFN